MKLLPIGKQGYRALIDEQDFDRVSRHHWKMNRDRDTRAVFAYTYAKSGELTKSGRRRRVQLSHFILGLKQGERVYHRNGNRLDCRKENLVRKNGGNVYFDTPCKRKPYKATVWIRNRNFYLGHYPSKAWAQDIIQYALPVAAECATQPNLTRNQIRRRLNLAIGRM